MNRTLLGVICFLAGIIVVPIAVFGYFKLGTLPVAVTDPAFPFEKSIVHVPLNARIHREMPKDAALPASSENLIAGAAIYKTHCAFCHGLPGEISPYAKHMYPSVPQLFRSHRAGVVGVSDDPVGETYWKVRNGIRLSGMPAYAAILTEPQMWQVSQLLASAARPLPSEAQKDLQP